MSQWDSETNVTAQPALGAFSAPRAAALGPADVIDVGFLTAARYHHHGTPAQPYAPSPTPSDQAPSLPPFGRVKRGTWTFSGSALGLDHAVSRRQDSGQVVDQGVLPTALGPPRHHMTVSPPTNRYTPPTSHVLTQRGSYPKKISSLRALHPDLGPISTSLLTDIGHEDAVQRSLPSFVLDHQGNCLALVQSTLEHHTAFAFTALNNTLAVAAIDTSCTPPCCSPTIALATVIGPSLLGISVSPLRHTLTSDAGAASPAEHTLVAIRSEYRVCIYRVAVSPTSASSALASSSAHPFAAAQLLDTIDMPRRCTRICASPFSTSEVMISTTGGLYLWRDSPSSTKRLKLILDELDVLRLIDPALAKQQQEAQTQQATVNQAKTRRSSRRSRSSSSLPLPSDHRRDVSNSNSADQSEPEPSPTLHMTCTWSPSPRFIFLHTLTTAYRLDLRAARPFATLEQFWTVPTTSQALSPGTSLPAPVHIQHMACDPASETLIIAAGPRLVLIDAREPMRVGVLANLGWTMSRELGVHVLNPIPVLNGSLVMGTASILHHTTHLVPIQIDPPDGACARRAIRQHMLPRQLPKIKQATPANEWSHGLRTVERVKHVEYPQDAPMVGCAMVPVRHGEALTIVQAFADGCVLSREVPVIQGFGAVKGHGDEGIAAAALADELAHMHLAPDPDSEWTNPPAPITIKYHGRKFVADPDEKLRALVAEAAKGGYLSKVEESTVLSAHDFGENGLGRLKVFVGFTPDDEWDLAQVFPRDQKRADVQRIAAIAQQVRQACRLPPFGHDEGTRDPSQALTLKSSILRAAVKDSAKLDSIEWSSGTQALAGKWAEVIAAASATFSTAAPPPPLSSMQVTATTTLRSRASAPLFSLGSKIAKRGPPTLSSSQPGRPAPSSSQVPGFANASQPHVSRVSAPLGIISQPAPLPQPPLLSQKHQEQRAQVMDSGQWSQYPTPPPLSQPLTGRRSMALSFDFGFGPTSALSSQAPPPPPPSQLGSMSSSQPDAFSWSPASASQLPAATHSQLDPLAQRQDSLGPIPSMSQPAHASRLSQGMDYGFGGMSLSQPSGQPPRKRKRTQGF